LVIVILLSRFFCMLPLSVALAIGRGFGWVWYYLVPIRRSTARQNVRRVLGNELSRREQNRIVRTCFAHLGMYAVESLRAPIMTAELSKKLVERVAFDERLFKSLEGGRGALVFTAHIGNIDMVGYSQSSRGERQHVVVKIIGWKPVQEFIKHVREKTGLLIIPPKNSKDLIKKALSDNEVVSLVVDQHMASHRAIVCEFFGQLASTSPAVARFALETGAPVFPGFIRRVGMTGHHIIEIEPQMVMETPYDDLQANIRHNTERINRHIEGWIRRYPEQWLWLHKRWKVHDDPTGWTIPPHLQHLIGATPPGLVKPTRPSASKAEQTVQNA
jgi:Kdo2-lipid IVA lauroyltransferase/acyltransferase